MKRSENVIYETSPATRLTEAYPLANGSLAALLYGTAEETKILLTHEAIGDESGKKEPFQIPFDGDYIEFSEIREYLASTEKREVKNIGELSFKISAGSVSKYQRSLDLTRSVAEIEFLSDANRINSECFISNPANVLLFQTVSEERVDAEISLDMFAATEIYAYGMQVTYLSEAREENCGKSYAAAMRINTDGMITLEGTKAIIKGATLIRAVFAFEAGEDVKACENAVVKRMSNASSLGYNVLKDEHIADVYPIFSRLEFSLSSPDLFDLSTSKRMKAFMHGSKDYALVVLMFNIGRYLYTATCRENSRCENLYGLWNLYSEQALDSVPHLDPNEWTPDTAIGYIRKFMTEIEDGEGYGVFPNMLFALGKYATVGNIAFSAALYEMMISEKSGRPVALPSMPKEFTTGSVKGIKIESGRMADISWCDGRVVEFKVYILDNSDK